MFDAYYLKRRDSFNEIASLYDEVRPSFAQEAFELLNEHKRLAEAKILEFGCGTGQSSLELSKRGATVTAIDVSNAMVEILKNKRIPYVSAYTSKFEDFDETEKFDIVYASQAKHWVPEDILYEKSNKLLNDDGIICWVRNNATYPDLELREKFDHLYRKHFAKLPENRGRSCHHDYQNRVLKEISLSKYFALQTIEKFTHEVIYDSSSYIKLMKTQSDHIVEGQNLKPLFESLEDAIIENGNKIVISYETWIVIANKK